MFFSTTALFTEFSSSSHAESASVELNIKVAPVISLHIEKNGVSTNELNLSANSTASGTFVKDDITAKVSTNNETGYTLTFANNDTDTSMHHTDTTITTTIPSITADTDEGSFPINSWAYALGSASSSSLTFSPIPTSTNATTIKSTTTPVLEDATNITFAAKVGTDITAGTYLDTVVFSATTNYVPNNLERISTMQQMTPQVCKQANIGDRLP